MGDWTGGETVTCENVTIILSTSLPILEWCLTATCYKWENVKSISSIDTGCVSIEHRAKTDWSKRPETSMSARRPSSHAAS